MANQTAGQPGKNFRIGTRVRMTRTADHELEGCFGTILGRYPQGDGLYMIHLDKPRSSGVRAASLAESNLERLPKAS
jgi:hypothetical protein